jgi:hypothetical protein
MPLMKWRRSCDLALRTDSVFYLRLRISLLLNVSR